MACELERFIEVLQEKYPGSTVTKRIQAVLADITLGSDEEQLGGMRANEAAYTKYSTIPVKEIYPDMKVGMKYGESSKTYRATVSKIEATRSKIYITVGRDKFEFDVKEPIESINYYKSNNGSTTKGTTHIYADITELLSRVSTLGSDTEADIKPNQANLRKSALDSVEGMKAIIDELDDADVGYKKYVKGLLDLIGPEFIRNKKLYINKDAERNEGTIGVTGIILNVAPNMDKSDKTATEVYAHELMHAITKFAIVSSALEAQAVVRQLSELRNQAAKLFSYKDFMPKQSLDREADRKKAEERYNYIFESNNSLHEFLAYGMTNKRVMGKLRANKSTESNEDTTLFEKIQNLLQKLLDVVLGKIKWSNVDKSMKAQLHQLTFELMEYNNKAVSSIKEKSANAVYESLAAGITVGNDVISGIVDKVADAFSGKEHTLPKRPKADASILENTAYNMKMLPKIMVRDDLKGIRELILSSYGLKPEGIIQNIIRDVQSNPTELERSIESLAMASDNIDRVRELTVVETAKSIREQFKDELTAVEDEAISLSLIDTDAGVLLKEYSMKDIGELLRNPEVLKKKIADVKTELKHMDRNNFYWNINQATGLGFYLATGQSRSKVQNLNAHNIAAKIMSGERRKPKAALVHKIDELSTLIGMQYTSQDSNILVSELIANNPEAVKYVLELNEGIKKDARAQIFETDVNIIKGYSKEIFDDTMDVRIRPLSELATMKYNGFELVRELEKDSQDPTAVAMGVYRSKLYVNNSFNRGASRITNIVKRGTSLTDIVFTKEDVVSKRSLHKEIEKIRKESMKEVELMQKGEYTPDFSSTLSPVLDPDGRVVDYRYMMGKALKKEMLGQDTRVTSTLGRTLGSVRDKVDTDLQNKSVLAVIQADMKTNYVEGASTGRNSQEYIKIEKNSPNAKVREIYKLLPNHMIEAINDSNEGFIAVRRDMLHNYFGFRDMSILDFRLIHGITPDILHKWIRYAEKMWQQIVSISKVDIIIRTPAVFIGNVISNAMYSIVNGASPMRVLRMQIKNMQAITDYLKVQAEIEGLRIAKMVGKDTARKIEMLESELKSNPVHDLMAAGMYQAIIEDLKKQDVKSSNKLVRKFENATESMPEYVKNGGSWLFLSEGSGFFKFMTTATQYSDFVARATEYQLLREKGVKKEEALQTILDVFVNYGKPASSFEEYLNNMGMFMFTKYMKRITRVVHKSIKEKPLNVLLSVLGQEAFFEVDDIQDQNLLTRSFSNLHQDMFKHFERAYTPSSLQFLGILD